MSDSMHTFEGQWGGISERDLTLTVNIDSRNGQFSGRVAVAQKAGEHEPIWIWSILHDLSIDEEGRVHGNAIDSRVHAADGRELNDSEARELGRSLGLQFPVNSSFTGRIRENQLLEVEWTSLYPDNSTQSDRCRLLRPVAGGSRVIHRSMTWREFRDTAIERSDGFIFRGQSKRWRLCTSFHRTGRADVVNYLDIEVPELERFLNIHSSIQFDVRDDRSLGAVLNLAQHHGYPTPLLDWTKSPYVAAFFAYAAAKRRKTVSVFEFDHAAWTSLAGSFAPMRTPKPILRTLELPGPGNARVLPQQSVTMYSNVDDIEALIFANESIYKRHVLSAISLPGADRDTALRDLSLMGINWGSLTPGMDGICRELRARHFGA